MKHIQIRNFLLLHYSDERLAALMAHAEDRKLSYFSCCCLIGTATADHTLRGHSNLIALTAALPEFIPVLGLSDHYKKATLLAGADSAEQAFYNLGKTAAERCEAIIPIIRKEMKRRERVRQQQQAMEGRDPVESKFATAL